MSNSFKRPQYRPHAISSVIVGLSLVLVGASSHSQQPSATHESERPSAVITRSGAIDPNSISEVEAMWALFRVLTIQESTYSGRGRDWLLALLQEDNSEPDEFVAYANRAISMHRSLQSARTMEMCESRLAILKDENLKSWIIESEQKVADLEKMMVDDLPNHFSERFVEQVTRSAKSFGSGLTIHSTDWERFFENPPLDASQILGAMCD